MKTTISLILTFVFFSSMSCEEKHNAQPKDQFIKVGDKTVWSSNAFGFALLKKLEPGDSETGNELISPVSIQLSLGMTYNGAREATRDSMKNSLHFEELSDEAINDGAKNLMDLLTQSIPKVHINPANSIWYRQEYTVEEDFLQTNRDHYQAEIRPVDFSDPNTLDTINKWVDEKTEGKIPEIIDRIDPMDFMILINAIYFKGIWQYRFDPDDTYQSDFYKANGTSVKVPMMKQKGRFRHYAGEDMELVELPYGNGSFSMVIALPADESSTGELIENLYADQWDNWMNRMDTTGDLWVHIPKFSFRYSNELNKELKKMGMAIAFSDTADFRGILKNGGLFIDYVKHKTFIEVNEEGAEAAAATATGISFTSVGPEPFIANRPFVFAIRDTHNGTLLFLGKVEDPTEE